MMDFAVKTQIAVGGNSIFAGQYRKPITCPRCGIGTDGPIVNGNKTKYGLDSSWAVVISITCTHCEQSFLALYEISVDKSSLNYLGCYPAPSGTELHAGLSQLSPRFAAMHKQSERAELDGLHEIAAIGYRTALEILVKDFAINELKLDPKDVARKKLAAAIGSYLHQENLVKTADVVRLLGNDFTHYQREYPEHDFTVLKRYYKIFIDLVATQYDIMHPPVSR